MHSFEPLGTQRLIVREFSTDDAGAYHAITCEPDVYTWHNMEEPPSLTNVEEGIRKKMACMAEKGYTIWAVIEKETFDLVGSCGLADVPDHEGEIELVYTIDPDRWGRGYATEASRAILAYGLSGLGLGAIIAMAYPDNTRSIRVMEKLGMRYRGLENYYQKLLEVYEAVHGEWRH